MAIHNNKKQKKERYNMTKAAKSVDTVRGSYTLIKNKHTNKIVSNIQHQKSNFKHLTFNSAITLIALIITIVLNCCGAAMV